MTISSSNGYKSAVYAPIRETRARVTINMSAFSQAPSQVLTLPSDFTGKVTTSTTENPNIFWTRTNQTSLADPSTIADTISQVAIDAIKTLDGTVDTRSTTTALAYGQHVFSWDIVKLLEKQYGMWIWAKRNPTLAEKVTIAKAIVTNVAFTWQGWGSSVSGNKATMGIWNGSTWTGLQTHTNGSVSPLTRSSNSSASIDANGRLHYIAYADPSDGTIASAIRTDTVSLVLTVTQTTNRTFDDSRIISADIVEETDILNITSPSNQLTIKLDNTDNLFSFISLNNLQTIVASRPKFFIEFGLVLADLVTVEWIPMGVFYMDNWQQDTGGMTVTFTCHDILMILANSSFPITAINNVGVAVQSLLSSSGVTDYVYDPLIDSLNGGNRPTRYTNCRQLLQNLAIGTGLTLYQDRYGTLKIVKFPPLQQATTYTTFTTSQTSGTGRASLFGGYPSSATIGGQPKSVSKQDTDGGMRAITIDQQFEIPQVTLEASVYQINVFVYKNNPSDPSYDIYTYTNPNISGNNGESFTIDNSLIVDTTTAQAVANRFFTELNYNLIYVARWRQNPVLEATDVIMMNDTETSAKQTRITKQEFSYQGFLTGTSESRGGV